MWSEGLYFIFINERRKVQEFKWDAEKGNLDTLLKLSESRLEVPSWGQSHSEDSMEFDTSQHHWKLCNFTQYFGRRTPKKDSGEFKLKFYSSQRENQD